MMMKEKKSKTSEKQASESSHLMPFDFDNFKYNCSLWNVLVVGKTEGIIRRT